MNPTVQKAIESIVRDHVFMDVTEVNLKALRGTIERKLSQIAPELLGRWFATIESQTEISGHRDAVLLLPSKPQVPSPHDCRIPYIR